MLNDPLPVAIIQVIFLIIASLATGAKSAFGRVNDYKMKELAKEGSDKAKRVIRLMEREAKVVAALRVAIISGFIFIGALGAFCYMPFVEEQCENATLCFFAMVVIHIAVAVIIGDMIPRKICTSKPDECAMGLSSFVSVISQLLRPVVFVLNFFSQVFVKISGNDPMGDAENVTEDDVMMMVDLGSEKGTIAPEEKELITNIFEFGDLCADDVMTHRKDVTVLMVDETPIEWEEKVRESGFSRFPVCGEDIDDIVGVVYARELYEFFYDKSEDISQIIRQAYIVPEKIGTDLLFENMQKEKTHFAIVADEYGGFAGIVTMDDLLGCIVGEIEDEEYDEEDEEEIEDIIKVNETTWDMDGLTLLEEVAELTGRELPIDEFDTLSGLVLHSIDYVPDDGATITVETCGLEITATEIKDRRIVRATVKLIEDVTVQE